MKKLIPAILLLLILSSFSLAQGMMSEIEAINSDLEGKEIPSPLDKLFSDERVNIYFDVGEEEDVAMGLITSNGMFSSLKAGELEDPSLNVYIAADVVSEIETADNPGEVFQAALKDGRISYEAVGFFNKIKFAAVNLVTKIGSWFAGDDDVEEEPVEEATEEVEEVTEDETETETEETEEVIEEVEEEIIEEVVEEALPETHIIEMIDDGFSLNGTLSIEVGETVEWKNVRTGNFNKAMIIGTGSCGQVKSDFFEPGESFSKTFDKELTCTIVDGVYTTQTMKLEVK
jgi:hypothetical protein